MAVLCLATANSTTKPTKQQAVPVHPGLLACLSCDGPLFPKAKNAFAGFSPARGLDWVGLRVLALVASTDPQDRRSRRSTRWIRIVGRRRRRSSPPPGLPALRASQNTQDNSQAFVRLPSFLRSVTDSRYTRLDRPNRRSLCRYRSLRFPIKLSLPTHVLPLIPRF